MKLVTGLFQEVIEIHEGQAVSLVIEKPDTCFRLLKDLYYQINGDEGDAVLSVDDVPCNISQMVELITSFVPFELNEKRLITKINSMIEKEALNEGNYKQTMELLAYIEKSIYDLMSSFPYNLRLQGLSIAALIKTCNIAVDDDSFNDIERVINYMLLVRELLGEKLFILSNMRMFFDENELSDFIQTINAHKFYVILVDGVKGSKIEGLKTVVVDRDLCVI